MDLVGRTNYTYDAKGTTLTVREPAIALHLKDCRNVTIRNLTIDWERPVLTEARIVGFSDGKTRIRIDTSRYPVAVEEGRLLVIGPDRRERIRAVRFLNGRTGAPVPLTADTPFRETRAREEADGTIVLAADYSHEGTGLEVGDILVFRPFERPYPAVFIEDSSGVLLEDVIIRDAYGMGVIAQMSEDIVWRGTGRAEDRTSGVIAREGSHVTTHADASHFSNCRGQVTVENCWFEGMMDDAINVHSTCVQITNTLSRSSVRCVFRHPEAIGFTLFRPGDRARLIRSRTNEDGPVLTVAAVRRVSDEIVELDFGTDLPADFGVGDTVENADYQCAATFRGNVVRNNRARGVLFTTPGKVICSSNRFERCCGSAVVLASDAAYWFESGHCRDVEIAGNVISNCLTAGYGRHGSAFGVISIDPIVRELDAQKDYCHGNIRIFDNEIFTFDATLLFARSTKDILWRNNVVRYNDDFKGWGRPPFVFERVSGFRNEPSGTGEGLRLGVLSDIHIDFSNGIFLENFEKALREYDKWGADAVLCCGDLANLGYVDQLEAVAATWFRVFPENRRSDGNPVVPLFHYGDHDMSGEKYSCQASERKRFADETVRRASILTKENRAAVWERCFREPWKPLMTNRIKGHVFVRAHFTSGESDNPSGNRTPGLAEHLSSLSLDAGRPFFYLQHRIPRGTAGGPAAWGQDDGTATRILSDYPNCIAFCGHGHGCSVDDRNLWQGTFTCIEVPSLRYCTTAAGCENGYAIGDRPPTYVMPPLPAHFKPSDPFSGSHQGLFVEVGASEVSVRRWDFAHDCEMAPPWRFPLPVSGDRPYAPEVRARTEPVPSFPASAKVSLRTLTAPDRGGILRELVSVEFPAATPVRANDYEVRLERRQGDAVSVLGVRHVYSPLYLWGQDREHERPVVCLWPCAEIPAQGDVRFVVEPRSSYGRRGAALTCSAAPETASTGGFAFVGRGIGPRSPLPDVPSTRALVPELTLHPVRTNGTEWTYPLRRLKTPTDGTGRPKPFLLNLRPRLAERPHLVLFDRVVVDRADYAKWCSEHPEYLGMQTLEWVHDAQTPYSPEWLARHRQGTPFAVTEDEVREALGRDEYRHGREDRHQFSTNLLRSAYNRIVELSFGDAKRLFIGDGTYCTDHLVADWGAGGLAFETTRNYYFWQIQMMFTRGAAVQYGIPFRWYIASFFNDGNQTADTPETGLSVSAVKRVSYLSYFSGAASYQREAGVELAYCYRRNPDASRNGTFGPEGLVYDEFYRFCTRHPRGEPYRAAALVVPLHRGYTRQGGAAYRGLFPYSREDHLLDAVMSVILDFPKNKDRRALKRHAERVMANSRYGDVFDVLCPDGERREFFRKALPRYRVAFVIGDSDSETDDALAAFERQGGRVVRLSADLVPWDGDDERSRQAALARVGCDRVMDFSQPVRFPGIERIMDDRVLPLLPFDVRGDVQFGFNRVQDGWIVYLINNAGVFKPAVGLASFDAAGSDVVIGLKGRKPSRVRLLGADCDRDLFGDGDGIGLNVPSGDVRVVHIAEGDPKCEMR